MTARWRTWGGFAVVVAATLATAWLCAVLWDTARGDISVYALYADEFFHHTPLHYFLPQEYPPLALLPFSLTQLALPGAPLVPFIAVFVVLFLLGYLGCLRFASPAAATRYALYLLLGAQGTLLDRFDLLPALLSLAALWCAERRHFAWAYLVLAIGAGLKGYPLALVPIIAIAHYRSRRAEGDGVALTTIRVAIGAGLATALTAALTFLPARLTDQQTVWVGYAMHRPVQVESIPSTLIWLSTLLGFPALVTNSFGAQGWVSGLGASLPTPLMALAVLGFIWVAWRQMRGQMTLGRAALCILCLLLVTSRVLSTQYLIWVLPVAALTGEYLTLWLAIALLTSLEYPFLYPYSYGLPPLGDPHVWTFMLTVALRNALLVVVTVLVLFRKANEQAPQPSDAAPVGVAPVEAASVLLAAERPTA